MALFPKIRLRVLPVFPARVAVENFLTVEEAAGVYTFGVDYTLLGPAPITDPTTSIVAVLDTTTGVYRSLTVSAMLSASQIEQHITAAGPVVIENNTGIVRVDQAIGAPITLTMGAAAIKTCPVLISDWKGDAGTNPITINLTGTDKFPGGLTSWIIGADTGSVFLRPIAGVGYVL